MGQTLGKKIVGVIVVLVTAATVVACGTPIAVSQSQYDDLRERVTVVEARVEELTVEIPRVTDPTTSSTTTLAVTTTSEPDPPTSTFEGASAEEETWLLAHEEYMAIKYPGWSFQTHLGDGVSYRDILRDGYEVADNFATEESEVEMFAYSARLLAGTSRQPVPETAERLSWAAQSYILNSHLLRVELASDAMYGVLIKAIWARDGLQILRDSGLIQQWTDAGYGSDAQEVEGLLIAFAAGMYEFGYEGFLDYAFNQLELGRVHVPLFDAVWQQMMVPSEKKP